MYIAIYKNLYQDVSLDDIITGLSAGLRSDIQYSDSQSYNMIQLTVSVVKGNQVTVSDDSYNNKDTVELLMELENNVRVVLEPNFDSTVQNGAGIVAVLQV